MRSGHRPETSVPESEEARFGDLEFELGEEPSGLRIERSVLRQSEPACDRDRLGFMIMAAMTMSANLGQHRERVPQGSPAEA
jgi:N-acetylglucosamine kinase-like BadF-type ATPase